MEVSGVFWNYLEYLELSGAIWSYVELFESWSRGAPVAPRWRVMDRLHVV